MEINTDVLNLIQQSAAQAAAPRVPTNAPVDARAALDAATQSMAAAVDALAEALQAAGLPVNDETKELAQRALARDMPLNTETLKALNQALRLMDGDAAKALFFVESGLPLNQAGAKALNQLSNAQTTVLSDLKAFAAAVDAMPEGAAKDAIVKILTAPMPDAQSAPKADAPQTQPQTAAQTQQTPPQAAPEQAARPVLETPQSQPSAAQAAQPKADAPQAAPQQPATATTAATTTAAQTATAQQAATQRQPAEAAKTEFRPHADRPPTQAAEHGNGRPLERHLMEALSERFLLTPGAAKTAIDDRLTELTSRVRKAMAVLADAAEEAPAQKAHEGKEHPREAAKAAEQEIAKLLEPADRLVKSIVTANEIRNIVYAQMPMRLDDVDANAELYVFRDKRKKGGKGASALLAVDMEHLGHVEAYVRKDDAAVECQFRVPNDIAERIRPHAAKLEAMLGEKGYSLRMLTFTDPGKRFSITDVEPMTDATTKAYLMSAHQLDERA